MNKAEYLAALGDNISQFREAAVLGLEPRVEACPDWCVGQLVVHLAEVYDFWSKIVSRQVTNEVDLDAIQQERKSFVDKAKQQDFYLSLQAIEWFDQTAEAIQKTLSEADPDRPNWTWWPGNQSAGFVQRRMCHETTIHRWDCQHAHNVETPISPPVVAADGIDEQLFNELTGWGDEGKTFPNATFHLHCSDTDGEWLVTAAGTSIKVSREHAKADVAASGSASDILLWLWHRTDSEALTVHGNAALLPELRDMLEQD